MHRRTGPALQIHHFSFKAGDAIFRFSQGGMAFGPRRAPRCAQNVGDAPGRLLVITAPSGRSGCSRTTPRSCPIQWIRRRSPLSLGPIGSSSSVRRSAFPTRSRTSRRRCFSPSCWADPPRRCRSACHWPSSSRSPPLARRVALCSPMASGLGVSQPSRGWSPGAIEAPGACRDVGDPRHEVVGRTVGLHLCYLMFRGLSRAPPC
jgi:hypothetical protein